jgi:hypothetical protein
MVRIWREDVSLGLRLLARLGSPTGDPEELFKRVGEWLQSWCSALLPKTRRDFVETYPTVFCQLHPAAEEVELCLIDPEHLVASANTSSVGPGYHIYLCELLKNWARDFEAVWVKPDEDSEDYSDETGFFFAGDEEKVFESMTDWLRTLAGTFFDGSFDAGDRGIALCMSLGTGYDSDHLAITPLGPRERDWMQATSEDGKAGKDFFAWWTPGLNAEYFLGRALTRMWTDVRWRKPLNDEEEQLIREVVGSLEIAHKLDPELACPWTEWQELLGYVGDDSGISDLVRLRASGKPSIGYRRGDVIVDLPGGWSIKMPGSFSDFTEDQDNDLYAVDQGKQIWFTAYRFTSASKDGTFEKIKQEIEETSPEYVEERENYIGRATIQEKVREDGEKYFALKSSNVCPTQRAVCTILFPDIEQRAWAVEMWRSLQPPRLPQGQTGEPD